MSDVHLLPRYWELRGYLSGDYESLSPPDLVGTVTPHSEYDDQCVVRLVKGNLTDELNRMIALRCREVGFKILRIAVPKGTTVTRYARKLYTRDGMDWYSVNLLEVPDV